jgi:hypothetical protein
VRFPEPHPGLVIRYSYLWQREHEEGREEGSKDRPCAIVLSVHDEEDQDGEHEVLVLAITHIEPDDPADGIEIPPQTKNRLGLDSDRSWIMINESNAFPWPGPDLRSVPGTDSIAYGPLPPKFFAHVRDCFLKCDSSEKATRVQRTE